MSFKHRAKSRNFRLWQLNNILFLYYCMAGLVILSLLVSSPKLTKAASGTVTGQVYRDYNESGTFENTTSFVEDGVGGVTVRAFDDTNAVVGTTTTALNGTYTLTITGATNNNIRVEFDNTTYPKGARVSHHGVGSGTTNSGTAIQFVTLGATKVDLGVNVPVDYCEPLGSSVNPNVVIPCYILGDPTAATSSSKTAIVGVPYNTANGGAETANTTQATVAQVGAVWGITWQPSSKSVFTSAFQKRHMGFGPLGTGGIYRIDNSTATPAVTSFVDLNSTALLGANATGANPHPNGTTNFQVDGSSFAVASKASLGGLTISSDELTLYTINLSTRQLLSISLGSNPASPVAPTSAATLDTIPTSGQVGHFTIPGTTTAGLPGATVTCATTGDVRPFGITYHDGLVYVGIVCTNQSSGTALEAYVYTYDPTTNTWGTAPVLEFPLTYTKGRITVNYGAPGPADAWNKWIDTYNGPTTGTTYIYPQAILSDINFFNGDMIIGLRDRLGDQTGPFTPPPAGGTGVEGITAGDILRASPVTGTAIPTQWKIESNAKNATGTRAFGPSTGANNNQGPGGGEFYYQDNCSFCDHEETVAGGQAQWPGKPEIVAGRMDPLQIRSGGLDWYSNTAGTLNKNYEIYPNDSNGSNYPGNGKYFEKAEGLGDIALLCDKAPIEIGNRVWIDSNGDGVQQPSETGLANVTVSLYDGATKVGSVTTNAKGEYYFDSSNVTGGLLNSHAYTIKLDNTANYTGTGPLVNYQLTKATVAADANHTATNMRFIDSDATPTSLGPISSTNFAQVSVTTGVAGANNHSYDIGLAPSLRLGNYIWQDTDNDGIFDTGETGIAGVTVNLILDANANGVIDSGETTVFATTTTDSTGHFYFNNLPVSQSGQDYLIQIPASNFTSGNPLYALTSSTGGTGSNYEANLPATLSATNNADHGVQVGLAGSDVISRKIVLATNTAPTGDEGAGTDQTTIYTNGDTNSNLVVDFGFTNLMRIGNLVWYDANGSGTVDAGENGIGNVTVQLYLDDGTGTFNSATDTLVATTLTDGTGRYYFSNIAPGNYFVQVVQSNFNTGQPLVNLTPDTVTGTSNNVNHGTAVSGQGSVSSLISLVGNGAPVNEESDAPAFAGGDNDSNIVIDFGFKPASALGMRLGNYVWKDLNNNGIVDVGEAGIANVTVNLILDTNGNGVIDSGEATPVATAITNSNGQYYFNNLTPNTTGQDYLVQIPASQFTGTGALVGLQSSTGGYGSPVEAGLTTGGTSSATNNLDHGKATGAVGTDVVSQKIVLTNGTAPAGDEVDATTTWVNGDTNSNLTIDMGFTPSQRLGNFVWNDLNNNGVVNGEAGLPSVKVNLYLDNGNGAFDPTATTNPDSLVATLNTDSTGHYYFNNIAPGNYFIQIDPSNFTTGGALVGYASSSPSAYEASLPSPASATNDTDHGKTVLVSGQTQSVVSSIISLVAANAPTGDEDSGVTWPGGDVNSNLTLDFGFSNTTRYRMGNYVFTDFGADGTANAGDTGIANVTVNLLDNTGTVVRTTTTDSNGYYYFNNLNAGSYRVQIAAANFNTGGVLAGWGAAPTTGTANNQNHGTVTGGLLGAGGYVNGPLVALGPNTEPTGDETDAPAFAFGDANSDSTQDFGFTPPALTTKMRLGNYVWKDLNNNGAVDSGEPAIAGVKVNLILDTNGNGVIDTGEVTPVATTTTDSTGHYYFNNLSPNSIGQDYLVQIDPTNFNSGGILAGLSSSAGAGGTGVTSANQYPYEGLTASSSTNNVDHGNTVATQGVVSPKIVLTANGAPTGDESDAGAIYANGDNNSNLTIDFGFTSQMRVGNLVWNDSNNNGVADSGEPGIAGVKVNLEIYNSANGSVTVIGTTTTDSYGRYTFDNTNVSSPGGLLPGSYIVQIDPTNFNSGQPLQNRTPSSVQDSAPTNNNNDGVTSAGNGVLSHVFTLVSGGAPTGDENDAQSVFAYGDNNSSQSVDFGFTAIPTGIQLAYFQTANSGGTVNIDWTTATEVGNLGFNVYFKPAKGSIVKLNSALIPSRQITGRRQLDYHLSVKYPGEGQYFLEDVSTSNRLHQFGPFALGQTFGEHPTAVKSQPERANPALVRNSVSSPRQVETSSFDLLTDKAGTYRLTYEYLASQGLDFSRVNPKLLTLTGRNGPVKVRVVTAKPTAFGPGDYIEFEAESYHNIYTDYNTYVLTTSSKGPQLNQTEVASVVSSITKPVATSKAQPVTARIEQNGFYWESADANTDPWFWDYLATFDQSSAEKKFAFDLASLTANAQGSGFKIHLQGFMADSKLNPNHRVHAWLNGVDMGSVSFNGTDAAVLEVKGNITLKPTANSLRLVLDTLSGATKPYDLVLFDYLEFSYVPNSTPVFTSLVSVREHQAAPPVAADGVNYLIITHSSFIGGVQPLVDLHTKEGLKVKVVDVNAIYDTYSSGIVDAKAIKSYLADQQKYGKLKYVLLVGADSYDPMNYYGQMAGNPASSPSFVPSLYDLDHYNFRAPSDQLYLGLNSPVAIGRLPVQNSAELKTAVGKIINLAQANSAHRLSNGATFVGDSGADFDQLNDTLAANLVQANYAVEKDYLDNNLTPDQARTKLVNQINSGNLLVNYSGHSGTNGWGLQTVLRESDVQALTNSANPLVVVQWACYNTYYATPYSRGLAETWLTSSGGAGFVLGATNQSITSDQAELATRFYKNVFTYHMSLGQALAKAKADMLAANPGLDDIAKGYVIMGDPAQKIN